MFTISVCLIVKNEEHHLARILECAKKFADEIIVVDTGSTDKTKQIALAHTQKVFDFEWCDDFSKARNAAFSYATKDFQMWLDADDFITDENIKKLCDLKNSSQDADVFMCKYVYDNLAYFRERLVKREKNFKWEGFVHEVIVPRGKIAYLDIEILHQKHAKPDPARNLKLYQSALKKNVKFTPREQYYYARELYYNGKHIKAIEALQKYLKMADKFPPDHLGALILLGDCSSALNQPEQALSALFQAVQIFLPTSEVCCKIAHIFDQKGETKKAVFWFKAALQAEKQTSGFVLKEYEEVIPCIELSRLLFSQDFPQAKAFHMRAKKAMPTHPAVIFNQQFFD